MKGFLEAIAAKVRPSDLSRNSIWMFLGFGLRIIVQAFYFILIARALGPAEYGAFVGAAALVGMLSPFCGLGSGNLLIKHVSRDRAQFAVRWGNALLLTAITGLALFALVLTVGRFVMRGSIPWTMVITVSIADLFGMRFVDLAGQAFQAMGQLKYTAQIGLLPNVLRLFGAAFVFFSWSHVSAGSWAWFYLVSTAMSAATAISYTTWKLGMPKLKVSEIRGEVLEGFYFSVGFSAQTVYNDIDKTMLASLSTLDGTGIYAAAYRLIDVSFSPVRSVLYAAYGDFFRHGKQGVLHTYRFAHLLFRKLAPYTIGVFALLLVASPIVPMVVGREYARSVEALRWLALLPLLKSAHYLLGDSLAGAGYQGYRTAAQIGVALGNILLNLWLIPAYSWRGAAWASIASDASLVLILYMIALKLQGKVESKGDSDSNVMPIVIERRQTIMRQEVGLE